MQTLKVSSKNLEHVLAKTVDVIKRQGVVLCPTDTVYGLIADANSDIAIKKIFKIKKRNLKKPLPVFVKNLKMAKSLAILNLKQEKILKKIWPGKVTVILRAINKKIPKGILSEKYQIGLRVPDYQFLNILLKKIDCPLAQTSANISGRKASTKISEVLEQFIGQKYQPDLILDSGDLENSLSSSVIDLISFKILRQGEFSQNKIQKIFKNQFDF